MSKYTNETDFICEEPCWFLWWIFESSASELKQLLAPKRGCSRFAVVYSCFHLVVLVKRHGRQAVFEQ
ncbi:unnamed protein product [Schistosoma turkestanicum]|nr:unnamed protein product [Schistosoma turkestanicum]